MLAEFHGGAGGDAMTVIGRGNGAGIDRLIHFLKHLAEIFEELGVGELLGLLIERVRMTSQRAIISPPASAAWLLSLSPFPPTPMEATRIFSLLTSAARRM